MEALQLVQQTIVYLEDHLLDHIDLTEMADYIGETAYHLNQTFTMICGMNPEEYVHRRRLSEAAQELMTGDRRLIDVAEYYGYNDAHSFSDDFSDYHGISPMLARTTKESLKVFNRLYVRLGVTEQPPLSFSIQDFHEVRLAGYRTMVDHQELFNHFLIPDLLYEAKESGHFDVLRSLTAAQQLHVVVHPTKDGTEIFYGVPYDAHTTLDIEYMKETKSAVFQQQGHIDFLYNKLWQSVEQQLMTLEYKKNDYYVSLLPLQLDFDSDYTRMTFVLPIK
ncbi:helix-turn-helix transcriptional regulator [Macrococcus equipercicus]|uniref:Helix-turn-helix transcriptional regulator n=1 Tax=Macrococcus equipercicus TaxID=69967 RepID=A0ABQ6RA17_9STAP|nr:AraC family transcriptional regulator [Macrococcus equipercicus]KAA1040149.1 helix-turn-helix transcriptional regulator [Macrococcus equipercicus]